MNETIDSLEGYFCKVSQNTMILESEIPWSKGLLKENFPITRSFCVKNGSPVTIKKIFLDFNFSILKWKRTSFVISYAIAGPNRKLKAKFIPVDFAFQGNYVSWPPFQIFTSEISLLLNPGEYIVFFIPTIDSFISLSGQVKAMEPARYSTEKEAPKDGGEDNNNVIIPKVPFDWKKFLRYMVISVLIGILSVLIYVRIQKIRAQI